MDNEILNKFTTHLRNVLARSYAIAVEAHASRIRPIHMLLALSLEKGSIGSDLLNKVSFDAARIRAILAKDRAKKKGMQGTMPTLSSNTKKVVEKSVLIASVHEHTYVGTEHLLAGVLQVGDSETMKLFKSSKVDMGELDEYLSAIFLSTSRFPEMADQMEYMDEAQMGAEMPPYQDAQPSPHTHVHQPQTALEVQRQQSKTPALDFFTTNLTDPKTAQDRDPMIGREKEVERIIQILSRRTKNNPLLLGDPGVGKTAIVEGLGRRIVKKDVPDALIGKKILGLDLGLVVAGTMYRGEFEARIKQILDELKANEDIILFIDEIHTIIGAGSSNGSMDAANMLKPALARGVIKCVGATTEAEYKKHIESDAALERRMQPIHVYEPSLDSTLAILQGIKHNFEKFHKVTISDEAIDEAVALAARYIPERFFPDKAIDVLDEAAAIVGMHTSKTSEKRQLLEAEEGLDGIHKNKLSALHAGDFKSALDLKKREKKLKNKRFALKRRLKKRANQTHGTVTPSDVQKVVSQMTGVPLTQLQDTERLKLQNLEQDLKTRVIGQDHVVGQVAQSIRRARLGLSHPDRPMASFLFVGPSGVGKTELAKTMAEIVFGDTEAFVRVDMSEFRENFNLSKLIGAPAGYVGYKEENRLTDQVKRRPHSLVLFDEIDKAHPDVLNILLQLLEDGHVTDAGGKKINFKNTIVVMTAAVESRAFQSGGTMGFDEKLEGSADPLFARLNKIKDSLKERFKVELLNRIDKIGVFKPLDREDITRIIKKELEEVCKRIGDLGYHLSIGKTLKDRLVENAHVPDQGARMVRKIISELIEDPLSTYLVEAAPISGSQLSVGLKNGDVHIKMRTTKAREPVTAKS